MAGFYKSYANSMESPKPGYKLSLGAPTNPMVAKQLEEFSKMLNQGIKNIEIGALGPDKFEAIPKQHFEEIKRLAKLTGSKPSMHGPLLDLAGFQENHWREEQRQGTEQQVFSVLERAHALTNGENVPVVFHAGNAFSQEYGIPYDPVKHPDGLYREEYIGDEKGNLKEIRKVPIKERLVVAINQETGEIAPLQYEKKYRIGQEQPEIWDPQRRLDGLNDTKWNEGIRNLLQYQKEMEELKEKMHIKMKQNEAIENTGLKNNPQYHQMEEENDLEINRMARHIKEINTLIKSDYSNTYHKFIKFSEPKERKASEHILGSIDHINKELDKKIIEKREEINALIHAANNAEDKEKARALAQEAFKKQIEESELQQLQSKQIVTSLSHLPIPKVWKPVNEFSKEKTAETVAGAVGKLYEKLKKEGKEKEMPIIALENFFTHTAMSRAEDLREAILLSREKLVEVLTDPKKSNLSKKEAEKEAEKLIGATWDVGHINNLRKAGYDEKELKEKVIEEAKTISDVVKHVHITDNFGFFDSHLPPGMGNVPIKEIMEELEKTWARQEKEGTLHQQPREIVEAGGFVAELGQNPTLSTLEYFGSPLYKLSPSPYWRDIAHGYSNYRESYMEFPTQHFNLYGSSFTTLPKSVGGQVGNETSRFSGTPNQ